jgi:hypothetical protein
MITATERSALTANGLRKSFGDTVALDGVRRQRRDRRRLVRGDHLISYRWALRLYNREPTR